MDIHHKEKPNQHGQRQCTEPVNLSSHSSSESSVWPVRPSLLQQRSPIRLSILTARTTMKKNTIHRHPDCTTCQVNLNMIKYPEIVPRSQTTSKVDKLKRNVMQPHVPSVKVPHKEHHDGKPSGIPATHEGQALPRGSNAKDSRPYHE